jgi:hypothetical protein
MTFSGDVGTLYPYLTLEKFSISKQNYGFLGQDLLFRALHWSDFIVCIFE